MKKLFIFVILACVLAVVDLYVLNISPYIAAGLAVGYLVERGQE